MFNFKSLLKIALGVPLALLVGRFCQLQTDGFALTKISSSLCFHPAWETPGAPPSFNATYFYLGKGAQCYVFLSEDQTHVLKFFRHSHLRAPLWLTLFPFPGELEKWRQEKIQDKADKLHKDFASYKIAYDEMREMTGLEYLHLNKTQGVCPQVVLVDKLGIHHLVALDKMEFLVQKKGDLLYSALEKLIQNGEIEQGKTALSSLIHLLRKRCEKGIFDKDPDLNTNFGIYCGEAIQIDIGRFKKDPERASPSIYREELVRITDHLRQWLDQKSPELSHHLQREVKNVGKTHL